ncbi:MAG: catechol 2,3-dioxygenase [Alicyclobacillaceae bacterium]|nr:catechol 2,3-dioxygenase [Alicyclobacillaceae bacterium]
MGIMRLGRVEVRVLDLEKSIDYYSNVIGLQLTARENGRAYFKAWDEEDHHSLIITEADHPGLVHMAFKVRFERELDEYEKALEQYGVRVNRVSKGTRIAEGQAIRFELPTGHLVELYHDIERVGNGLKLNPDPYPENLKGIAPPLLDHLLITGEDVQAATDLLMKVFDFHMSERVVTVDGEQLLAVWLFRTNTPHDIAIIKGPNGKLHHFAFNLGSWNDILRAADCLAKNNVAFDVPPTRHGITRGTTIYFFDPSGNRNEVFSGGYIPHEDFTPVTWTEDQLGRGIFYHMRELNERFTTALT